MLYFSLFFCQFESISYSFSCHYFSLRRGFARVTKIEGFKPKNKIIRLLKKKSKVVLGFRNFGYDFLAVRGRCLKVTLQTCKLDPGVCFSLNMCALNMLKVPHDEEHLKYPVQDTRNICTFLVNKDTIWF
jgi:hypothetical protein